jgi:phosphinothricin acetyltransferase
MENMATWFDTKIKNNFPAIGLVNEQDELMGFGSYGTFRAFPAYKYTVEHSLYVQKDHRGKGLGKILLSEIIKNAQAQDYHCLIAAIDSTNEASIRLHSQFDFEFCGRIKQAGYKFGTWLNVDFYQLLLETPTHPVEL